MRSKRKGCKLFYQTLIVNFPDMNFFSALKNALASLLHPRMLALLLLPMGVSLLLWGGLAVWFWGDWTGALGHWLASGPAGPYIDGLTWLAGSAVTFLILLILIPLAYVTALLIVSVFAMPMIVRHVAQRRFPGLHREHGGSNLGSAWNSLLALLVYLLLWFLTLPLWLLSGPLALAFPVLLNAYLNQRLFRYDALAEHASREEFAALMERSGGKLYLLGGLLGLLQYVPLLNFLSPVYIGLVFTHFCLEELEKLRMEKVGLTTSD